MNFVNQYSGTGGYLRVKMVDQDCRLIGVVLCRSMKNRRMFVVVQNTMVKCKFEVSLLFFHKNVL